MLRFRRNSCTAIVQTGGKQYKVEAGDQVKVEKLKGEPGDKVDFDKVLAIGSSEGINIGQPFIKDASVTATIIRTARDRKIIVLKKNAERRTDKKQGHRQWSPC